MVVTSEYFHISLSNVNRYFILLYIYILRKYYIVDDILLYCYRNIYKHLI